MAERYVRPPLVPSESPPAWVARSRFRATALALLVLLLIAAYLGFEHFSGAATQDPGLSSLPAFGQDSLPAFGQDSLPAFGQDSLPAFGQDSLPAFG